MEQLLLQYGFKKTKTKYEYQKHNGEYIALLMPDGKCYITTYSPNYHRYMWSNVYETIQALQKELKKNHYISFSA